MDHWRKMGYVLSSLMKELIDVILTIICVKLELLQKLLSKFLYGTTKDFMEAIMIISNYQGKYHYARKKL